MKTVLTAQELISQGNWSKLLQTAVGMTAADKQRLRDQVADTTAKEAMDWSERVVVCLALSELPWIKRVIAAGQPPQCLYVEQVQNIGEQITLAVWALSHGRLQDDSIPIVFRNIRSLSIRNGLEFYGLQLITSADIKHNRSATKKVAGAHSIVGTRCVCTGIAMLSSHDLAYPDQRVKDTVSCGDGTSTQLLVDNETAVIDVLREDSFITKEFDISLATVQRWHGRKANLTYTPLVELIYYYVAVGDRVKLLETARLLFPTAVYIPVMLLSKNRRAYVHIDQIELSPVLPTKHSWLFDQLCVPPRTKQFLQQYIQYGEQQAIDLVSQKSLARCLLLTGPPGVGKTLTAEAVAAYNGKPLYFVSCTNLGQDSEELQAKLSLVAERARRWDAIVLLDDADVYVASRLLPQTQVALVSQTLAFLERYRGWVFITTNMHKEVDDAVVSRCYLVRLQLPSETQLAKIWQVLLQRNGYIVTPALCSRLAQQRPKISGRSVLKFVQLFKCMGEIDPADEDSYVRVMRKYATFIDKR